jgi:RNA polymerase sigma factor (sigma-70 family)
MASVTRADVLRPIYRLWDEGTLVGASDAQLLARFVARRDETAFAALVARHGRAVLAVCRDVLRDPHDAEDAFQATFVILVRKAGSLWVKDSLAAWLHRVARRVAVEANRQNARRRAIEKPCTGDVRARTNARASTENLRHALHEEIDRLPEKYRVPIILCDLEELTRDEAAHRLGWRPGTVAGRLARARALLRERVVRRGHVEAGAIPLIIGVRRAWHVEVPVAWINTVATSLAMSPFGSKEFTEVLARGVISAMTLAKFKFIAAALFAGSLASTIVAWAVVEARPDSSPIADAISVQESTTANAATGQPKVPAVGAPVAGTIVDHEGKPVTGVRVFYSARDHGFDFGHVRSETRADAEGRYTLAVPTLEGIFPGGIGTGTLWAYRPGSLVALMPVHRGYLPPGLGQRLVLGPPARAAFEVRSPDGAPVVGAQVEPRSLRRRIHGYVPDGLAELIGADTVTDSRGRAVMNAFFLEEVEAIRVVTEKFGKQEFAFGYTEITADTRVVTLQPVGRLKGRLVGEPQAIRRRPLSVVGFSPPDAQPQRAFLHDIITDDEGHFDIPAIAVGYHGVRTVPRYDSPSYASVKGGLVNVAAGQSTEVVMPLKPAIKVHGEVRESGTGKPIAGVRVAATMAETGAMTTRADGTYEGYVPPDGTSLELRSVPPDYVMPVYPLGSVQIPDGVEKFELPPIELTRAGELRGLVVSEGARPAIGAEVVAEWKSDEGRSRRAPHRLTVRTGSDGRFLIDRVPEGVDVELSANHRHFRTPESRLSRVGEASILRLEPADCVSLFGRVVDPAGRPIAGAVVHLRSRRSTDPNERDELVDFDNGSVLLTDAEGHFRTPEELNPGLHYMAYASAANHRYTRTSAWMQGDRRSLGDMILQPQTENTPPKPTP